MGLAAAALYAVLAWWLGTGVILWLNGRPQALHPALMAAATVLCGVALCGIAATAGDTRPTAAYVAFTAAVTAWGWLELAFLLGYVTGPRRLPCPPGARGWRRVGHALAAVLWHELALIALGAAVAALTWRQPNTTALWTYAVLWTMRCSAKLNVFLGVRNLNEEFLPPRLRYLASYFRHRAGNRWFATSVIAATLAAAAVWHAAAADDASPHEAAAAALVATLLTLAVLEHWLMVLPLPSEPLWRWSLGGRAKPAPRPEAGKRKSPVGTGL